MEDELITFETAKLAKEEEFDWKVTHYRKIKGVSLQFIDITTTPQNMNKFELTFSTPTQSLLQKWLREVHNIDVSSIRDNSDLTKWTAQVLDWNGNKKIDSSIGMLSIPDHYYYQNHISYQEALEKGLYESLLILKLKNEN